MKYTYVADPHQTTAHTLGFTFALLALYSDEQEILYEHIKEVLANKTPVRSRNFFVAQDN